MKVLGVVVLACLAGGCAQEKWQTPIADLNQRQGGQDARISQLERENLALKDELRRMQGKLDKICFTKSAGMWVPTPMKDGQGCPDESHFY